MAKFSEIPTFVAGEPGFAAKLNQLGTVIAEVAAAQTELAAAVEGMAMAINTMKSAPKTAARKTTAAK